jgi:hypothetical protein
MKIEGNRYPVHKVKQLAERQKEQNSVKWVNSKLIQDRMILNHVVKFHENRMKSGGDRYTR